MYPFSEVQLSSNCRRRTFEVDVDAEELTWHRDAVDRRVEVIEGSGWYLQYDNELPISLKVGDVYQIPAAVWHRVIRRQNSGKLIVEIIEA